jgi:transcriptional regulator with XRE-family HTH domain
VNNEIWSNLRKVRKSQNKSLEDVAENVGLNTSSLSRIETGNSTSVSFKKIYDLSRYYNVSLEKLATGSIEEKNLYDKDSDGITVSKEEMPYYSLAIEAKKEGLSVKDTKNLILLFKRITSEIQRRNIQDEYYNQALKAKGNGISEAEFSSMVDILIKSKKDNN